MLIARPSNLPVVISAKDMSRKFSAALPVVLPLSATKHDRLRLLMRRLGGKLQTLALVIACSGVLLVVLVGTVSPENSFDRVQAGHWVVASMYWEDKLDASGNTFNPIGWHAAHKTLPLGTQIRVSNPQNHRSINITVTDRGPNVKGRDLDLTLGAGALLGFKGLGKLYMEVLSFPPEKLDRPVLENLFAVNERQP